MAQDGDGRVPTVVIRDGGLARRCLSTARRLCLTAFACLVLAWASVVPAAAEPNVYFGITGIATTPLGPHPSFICGNRSGATFAGSCTISGLPSTAISDSGCQSLSYAPGSEFTCKIGGFIDPGTYTFTISAIGPAGVETTGGILTSTGSATATSVSVAASTGIALLGQSIQFTATVIGSGTPTGIVTFRGHGGLVTTVAVDATGSASTTFTPAALGTFTVTADYSGDATHEASSGSATAGVYRIWPSSVSVASLNSLTIGQPVQVSATVISTGTPTGSLTFRFSSGEVRTATLDASGSGVVSFTPPTGGTFTVSAAYSGDAGHDVATGSGTLDVNKYGISPSLTLSPASPAYGDRVIFTTTVVSTDPARPPPTGVVTIRQPGRGGGPLGTSPLDANGVATFTMTVGVLSGVYAAVYEGDANYFSSSSNTIRIDTTGPPPLSASLTIASSPNPSAPNQQVTFTATLPANATGTVSIRAPGVLCSAAPIVNGTATCLGTISGGTGTYIMSATYAGDVTYVRATASSTHTVASQSSQTIAFTPPSGLVFKAGATVALNATASSGLAVTFTSMTPAVCSVSGATATVLAIGTCTIKASQAGDANMTAAPDVTVSFGVTTPPALTATGTVTPDKFSRVGESLVFVITINNTGSVAATGVAISEPRLPDLACAATTVAAGGQLRCQGTVSTTAADLAAGKVSISPKVTFTYAEALP